MATAEHHLSHYDPTSVPSGAGLRFALVVSEWNHAITGSLLAGAQETLLKHGVADADLLVWAAAHQRAIVTENIRDFVPLAQRWAAAGQDHAGLVFTNPRRFHRATLAYPGTLIDALATWLPTAPDSAPSMVWWL